MKKQKPLPPPSALMLRCLEVMRQYVREHGHLPTTREIGQIMGKGQTSVVRMQGSLVRRGILQRKTGRGFVLAEPVLLLDDVKHLLMTHQNAPAVIELLAKYPAIK